MREQFHKTGRIAFRVEGGGDTWNAYWALPHTMEGAIWLGGIRMRFVQDKVRKQMFMDLIRESLDATFEELGWSAEWPGTVSAPEHERGGNG
jgi:hypothetical protein